MTEVQIRSAADYSITATISVVPAPLEAPLEAGPSLVKWRVGRILCAVIIVFVCGFRSYASQAMTNLVDETAARQAVSDYANNILRVESADVSEWDDSASHRVDRFPANMPFQLIAGPNQEDRVMAEAAIETVKTSMPTHVRKFFTDLKIMAPVEQWLIRRSCPGVTNESQYLSSKAQHSVWRARDFDLKALAKMSGNMSSNHIPLLVKLQPLYEEYKRDPIKRAQPLVDYSDPRPEVTYETPFGVAIVLRAHEKLRKFRFVARSWPMQDENVNFAWVQLPPKPHVWWMGTFNVQGQKELSPKRGWGEIKVWWHEVRPRMDFAVFARYGEGPYGPPSIISFYTVPNEKRTYNKQNELVKIEYLKTSDIIPQLYQNKLWYDEFTKDSLGNVIGFERTRQNEARSEVFSIDGEYVVETYAGDVPKITRKVRYFTSPTDLTVLDYEITDKEVSYPYRPFSPRNRGEFRIPLKRR